MISMVPLAITALLVGCSPKSGLVLSKSTDSAVTALNTLLNPKVTVQISSNTIARDSPGPTTSAPFIPGAVVVASISAPKQQKSLRGEPIGSFEILAGQKWAGRAQCDRKEIALRINITAATPPATPSGRRWLESSIEADLELGPAAKPEGVGRIKGRYGVETRDLEFFEPSWTVLPGYSPFTSLRGLISKDARIYQGKMIVLGCRDFQLSMDPGVAAQLVSEGREKLDANLARVNAAKDNRDAKRREDRAKNPNLYRYYSLKTGEELDCDSKRTHEAGDGKMQYFCLVGGDIFGPESQRVWEKASRKAPASHPDLDVAAIRAILNSDPNAPQSQQEGRVVSEYPADVSDICLSGNERACKLVDSHVEYTLLDVARYSDRTLDKMRSALMKSCKKLTGEQSRPCSGVHAIDFHRAKMNGFNDPASPRWCLLDKAQYISFQKCTVSSEGAVLGCQPPESEVDSYVLRNSCPWPVRLKKIDSFDTRQHVIQPGGSFQTGISEKLRWVIRER